MMPATDRAEHSERHWKTALCDKAVTLVLRDPERERLTVNVIMRAFHAPAGGPDQETTSSPSGCLEVSHAAGY